MGEGQYKPGHYWDCREAAWVRYSAPETVVPSPAEPADNRIEDAVEAETPAG